MAVASRSRAARLQKGGRSRQNQRWGTCSAAATREPR